MLVWKIKTGDEKLAESIQNTKEGFDQWFMNYWAHRCSRERMLSPDSPLEHIYYKMCKTFEEVKEKYPEEAMEKCSSCGEHTSLWLETAFSFCDEYGCGMTLCPKCAEELKTKIEQMLAKNETKK